MTAKAVLDFFDWDPMLKIFYLTDTERGTLATAASAR
jgi:hypothetical protein